MDEFCKKFPFHCKEDTSNLTVPFRSGYMNIRYLSDESFNDELAFEKFDTTSKTRTFAFDYMGSSRYLKCYSENLHLYQSGSQPKNLNFDFENYRRGHGQKFAIYLINQLHIELFYPLDEPKVLFAVHSPFLPVDPTDLHAMKPGLEYAVTVELEKEEHLMPPPYQTNCNGPSTNTNDSTNPNSFQLCVELCSVEFSKAAYRCAYGMSMIASASDLCLGYTVPYLTPDRFREEEDKRLACMQNCKQGCLKLQYNYKINERDTSIWRPGPISEIKFSVKNPEVTVLKHVPLYGTSEIFSNVGGLLGCWLGISVFSFTDILEKFFRKVLRWKKKIRKSRRKRSPISAIHQD